jgi:hypothetical protein
MVLKKCFHLVFFFRCRFIVNKLDDSQTEHAFYELIDIFSLAFVLLEDCLDYADCFFQA